MESTELQVTNHELAASATAAQAKAEIECAYVMAIRRPRNVENARAQILGACKRPIFAESVEWTRPVGGESISGPTIRFAETAMQAFGNLRTTTTVIYEDDKVRKVHVSVIDLENNNAYGLDTVVAKTVERKFLKKGQSAISERLNSSGTKVFLVEATEDELACKQGAVVSKMIRNCGLRLIPQDIIEEAMATAKTTREKGLGDPEQAKRKILDAFSELGIKPTDVEAILGKRVEQAVAKDLDDLRKIYTAIKSGESKLSDYLQDSEQPKPKTIEDKLKEAANKPPAPPKTQPKTEYKAPELTPAQALVKALDPIVVDTIRGKHDYPDMLGNWSDEQCSAAIDEAAAIEGAQKGRGF